MMRRSVALPSRRSIERAVLVAIPAYLVVTLAVATWSGGRAALANLGRIDPAVLLLALALVSLHILISAARWRFLSRPLGVAVGWRDSLVVYAAGFPMMLTPGRIGELVRPLILKQRHGLSLRRALPVAIGDRVLDLAAIVVIGFVAALAGAGWPAPAALVAAGLVAALAIAARAGPSRMAARVVAGLLGRRRRRLAAKLAEVLRHVRAVLAIGTFLPALAISIVGWSLEVAAFAAIGAALGLPLGLADAGFIFAAAALAGVVLMTPGGVGGSEATMVALLHAGGAPLSVAVLATALLRLATLGYAVLVGLVPLAIALRRPSPTALHRSRLQPSA
ncbi:MAG: YbhN family protein [Alphaproteobacteria bacterium]